jgi:hypothetical protein
LRCLRCVPGGRGTMVWFLGSHTLRAHPCIFPQFFWCAFLVASVEIRI